MYFVQKIIWILWNEIEAFVAFVRKIKIICKKLKIPKKMVNEKFMKRDKNEIIMDISEMA